MKKELIIIRFFFFSTLWFLSSCGILVSGLYGIRNVKSIDKSEINKYAKQFYIPLENSFVLDTNYIGFIKDLYGPTNLEQINNHLQPLQAMYFNEQGLFVSYQVNCYAGGFPNLKWNRNHIMEAFPPLQQAPIDTLIRLNELMPFIKGDSLTNLNFNQKYDFTVVVFWNRFMGRQSKRFIKELNRNFTFSKDKKVKVVYVNNDNLFLD